MSAVDAGREPAREVVDTAFGVPSGAHEVSILMAMHGGEALCRLLLVRMSETVRYEHVPELEIDAAGSAKAGYLPVIVQNYVRA